VLKLKTQKSTTVFLIALLKLAKGVGLLAVAVGALHFLHRDLAQTLEHWVYALRFDPENHYVHSVLSKALNVSPKQLKLISAGTFLYSAMFLTEGIGLLLRRRWAEYFTIISTALFIPLEAYELAKHVTLIRILVTLVNVAIVVYLIRRVRTSR
jgi:uncharacterized membrane protein (DUF2068 family)